MRNRLGFTLIELMIVIVILGILSGMTGFMWNRYVANADLRAAARDVAADIAKFREMAKTENRVYNMNFNTGANNYTITAAATTNFPATFSQTKSPTSFANHIRITAANFSGANDIFFRVRGTSDPMGTVTLQNRVTSTAVITVSMTGKAYVTFDIK